MKQKKINEIILPDNALTREIKKKYKPDTKLLDVFSVAIKNENDVWMIPYVTAFIDNHEAIRVATISATFSLGVYEEKFGNDLRRLLNRTDMTSNKKTLQGLHSECFKILQKCELEWEARRLHQCHDESDRMVVAAVNAAIRYIEAKHAFYSELDLVPYKAYDAFVECSNAFNNNVEINEKLAGMIGRREK